MCWLSRCSRRSSCILPSASLKNGSRTSAAAGCFRWSTHPAPGCSASGSGPLKPARPPACCSHRLDQTGTAYDAVFYILAAALFLRSYSRANTPLLRQQLKWLTRGTLLAVVPFTLFYAIPFFFDLQLPSLLTNLAGFSIVFLPLTFSWAIVRYRLMDTDLIFKRGVAYTLATGLMLGAYFGIIALVAAGGPHPPARQPCASGAWCIAIRRRRPPSSTPSSAEFRAGSTAPLTAIATTTARRWSNSAAASVLRPISRPCSNPSSSGCRAPCWWPASRSSWSRIPAACAWPPPTGCPPKRAPPRHRLALGFLDFDQANDHSHIFLENAQAALHLPRDQQRAAALLDLNYYLPCRVAAGQMQASEATPFGQPPRAPSPSSAWAAPSAATSSPAKTSSCSNPWPATSASPSRTPASTPALKQKSASSSASRSSTRTSSNPSTSASWPSTLDDRIESWNAQMEAMYALSRAEAIGQPLATVFPAEFIEALEGFRNEQGVHHLYKFPLTTRAGEQRTANIAIAPLLSRDFVSVGRIILVDDITERVSLETQLAQADKLSSIGLLAAGVAHEINTPLAVISSYAQMLSKQLRGDARLGPVLEKITQQSFRAAEIANGLLNFSRTSTTEFRETNLNQVIRDTLSLLEHQFKTAQIVVDLDLAEELPPIHGNPGKLQQVFLNLLLNAKEAMPGGGRLRVATLVNGHVEASRW